MSTDTTTQELTRILEEKRAFIKEGAEKGIKVEGNNVEMKSEDFKAMQQAMADAREVKSLLEMKSFDGEIKTFMEAMAAPAGSSSAVAAMAAMAAGEGGASFKSLGEAFTASDEFKALKTSGGLTMAQPYEFNGADVTGYGQKDIFTASTPGTTSRGFGRTQRDPMVQRPQRVNRVRDLFPVATTNANLIDYFRVLGFVERAGMGNAGPVAERAADNLSFALKNKSNLRFESAQAPVRTIAHWEAAHRNVLSDEPQLQSTINNELLYGLSLEEDNQIINGDGTGENLLGILNTPNIQTYVQVAGDQKSDALRRAATLAIIANYPPTGYVLHPNDWEDVELQKATAGDGQYMLVTNFTNGLSTTIWRQPVVETPAIDEGTFLTGAFGIGAQLYDRQAASVRIAEQHADFFVRNAVAILAEERIALAVKRPESFVVGTFTADVTP